MPAPAAVAATAEQPVAPLQAVEPAVPAPAVEPAVPEPAAGATALAPAAGATAMPAPAFIPAWTGGAPAGPPAGQEAGPGEPRTASSGCTLSQLRRFVKSRPYVPLHELRRRFALNGSEDDVVPLETGGDRLYVGLPEREARLLEELLQHGEVGYECSLDPPSPIIVGVYPMRPVPRQ